MILISFSQSLYTYPDNFRAYKILIAAEYSGAKISLPPFKFGETNQTAEFLKKFPLGKVFIIFFIHNKKVVFFAKIFHSVYLFCNFCTSPEYFCTDPVEAQRGGEERYSVMRFKPLRS